MIPWNQLFVFSFVGMVLFILCLTQIAHLNEKGEINLLKYDGHIHTPFCPHGTKDELNRYCEQAIKEGLSGITFTEHAPLPENFVDPAPTQDSAMPKSQLYQYIEQVQAVRTQYKGQLTVGVGLEVDFIEGYEKEVTTLLNDVECNAYRQHFVGAFSKCAQSVYVYGF